MAKSKGNVSPFADAIKPKKSKPVDMAMPMAMPSPLFPPGKKKSKPLPFGKAK